MSVDSVIATYLSDVPPPWNKGKGLAITRFNEKIIGECGREEEISKLRENNANRCAQEDAEKKQKAKGGPGGQGGR